MRQVNHAERLDSTDIPFEERKYLLEELHRANKLMGVYRNFLKYFEDLILKDHSFTKHPEKKIIRILEIGAGTCGLATNMIPFLKQRGFTCEYHILDIHTDIMEWAKQQRAAEGFIIETHDGGGEHLKIFDDKSFDFVISLHVLHHIHPVETLRHILTDVMRIAEKGFFMADFDRRFMAIPLFKYIIPCFKVPKILCEDGVKSVRRSYTVKEMHAELNKIDGIKYFNSSIKKLFPPYQIIFGNRK